MRRNEHRDPYPLTWELPAAAVALLLVTLVGGAHLGRAAANVLAGRGLAFPGQADVLRSVPRLLSGDADAGLSGLAGQQPSRTVLLAVIAVVELLLLVGCGWLVKAGVQQWGPGRARGMASASEAERLLGRRRLRRVAAVVRPDLYGPRQNSHPGSHPGRRRGSRRGRW